MLNITTSSLLSDITGYFTCLSSNAKIDTLDSSGASKLHWAIISGDTKKVKSLIAKGASLEVPNAEGDYPIHIAAAYGYLDILKLLIDHGANLYLESDKKNGTPLHFAALYNQVEALEFLQKKGMSLDLKDKDGTTPIYWGIFGQSRNAIRYLITQGVSLETTSKEGATPLVIARALGFEDIEQLLIESGARVLYADKYIQMKMLASYMGIGGQWFIDDYFAPSIESGLISLFHPITSGSLDHYFREFTTHFTKADVREMKDIIKKGATVQHLPSTYLMRDIVSGKPVLFNAGWEGHVIEVFFSDSYLFILNKGEGRKKHSHIMAYKINPTRLTYDKLEQLKGGSRTLSESEGKKFLYEDLVEELNGNEQNAYMELFHAQSIKSQKIGNCTTASSKLLIRLLFTLFLQKKGYDLDTAYLHALKMYKEWTDTTRVYLFEKYIKDCRVNGDQFKIDRDFVNKCLEKWDSRATHHGDNDKKMQALVKEYSLPKTQTFGMFMPLFFQGYAKC